MVCSALTSISSSGTLLTCKGVPMGSCCLEHSAKIQPSRSGTGHSSVLHWLPLAAKNWLFHPLKSLFCVCLSEELVTGTEKIPAAQHWHITVVTADNNEKQHYLCHQTIRLKMYRLPHMYDCNI